MHRVLMLFCFVLCTNCATAVKSVPRQEPPVYPFWTSKQLAEPPQGPPAHLPHPAAAAVLVAKGYLVASMDGMGDIADDALLDPTVYLFDGAAWHIGRYVDRDKSLHLALIRADMPGTPMVLQRDDSVEEVVGIALVDATDGSGTKTMLYPMIYWHQPTHVIRGVQLEDVEYRRCMNDHADVVIGAAILDRGGNLAGVVAADSAQCPMGGPDAGRLREFIDLYFASWGRTLEKPQF